MNFKKYLKYFKIEKKEPEKKEGLEKKLSNQQLIDISLRARNGLYSSGFIGVYGRRM